MVFHPYLHRAYCFNIYSVMTYCSTKAVSRKLKATHLTILPVVTKDLPIPPPFTPYIFLSRCKFSTLTTRQLMVELYLLTFPRFPLRKKEHKSYFGKNRTRDFRTSRCAGLPTRPLGRRGLRDQILRHVRGQGNIRFPCSADHEQDWQPYPVDPHSALCDGHTYVQDFCTRFCSHKNRPYSLVGTRL